MELIRLDANQQQLFYRGGECIAGIRGIEPISTHAPEDWIASVVGVRGTGDDVGLTRLSSGELLAREMTEKPAQFFGPAHLDEFGATPGFLLKYLDAGERLPVHVHPDAGYARAVGCGQHGKNEAWLVLETYVPNPMTYVGFKEPIEGGKLEEVVGRQAPGELLAMLNEVPVAVGDVVFVPAGVPHAIGDGIFIAEIQEPIDLSIMMEYARYGFEPEAGASLGLGMTKALEAVDRRKVGAADLDSLRGRWDVGTSDAVTNVLPELASDFFRVDSIHCAERPAEFDSELSLLMCVSGSARIAPSEGEAIELRRGDTALVPFGAGPVETLGDATILRCRPPLPARP